MSKQQADQYFAADRSAQARVRSARAALASRRQNWQNVELRAPDDGVISSRTATEGSVPSAGTELFKLIRQGRLEWQAELGASDLMKVKAGDRAVVHAANGREVLARARQLGLDPERVIQLAEGEPTFEAVGRFFETYLTIADFDGALDYTELVHRARLLLADTAVAEACRSRFDAVLVDDAQELDQVAANLLADLARIGLPLLVFGDPQQRLGSFRGASAASITLLRRLPGAETLGLVTGHRNRPAVAKAIDAYRRMILDALDD